MYREDKIVYTDYSLGLSHLLFTRVYAWMFAGLAMTALMSLFIASQSNLVKLFIANKLIFFGLIIGELLLVMAISSMINKMSAATAGALFAAYSLLNGITLSVIFLAYQAPSVAGAFAITAGTFGVMSLYGYFTKADLSKLGNILFMALIGLIIASVVNIFLKSSQMEWIISLFGVAIFVGLTAYDTNKIKRMLSSAENSDAVAKIAIIGALTLYLDFINLFLFILRLFGRRR